MKYPKIVWERERGEIIACGPRRYRLLWEGRYVATFEFLLFADHYAELEFLTGEEGETV